MRLILASASPRRAELLSSAGFEFEVAPADVDESRLPGEQPASYALRVAVAKADAAARADRHAGGVVLAADTVVVVGDRILGKPTDDADARSMLGLLSATVHIVLTAVVVRGGAVQRSEVVSTRVHFRRLTDEDIAWYIQTREPEGKAGAYAIQGRAARFIDWIDGSWSNVVGLPIATVDRLLRELGRAVDPPLAPGVF
jgi:septum formation protein